MEYLPVPMVALRSVPITDPCVCEEVRKVCEVMGIDRTEAWFDGKEWIGLFPEGAFGEKMDKAKLRFKAANARQSLMDLSFYGKGLLGKDDEEKLYQAVALCDELDSVIQEAAKAGKLG